MLSLHQAKKLEILFGWYLERDDTPIKAVEGSSNINNNRSNETHYQPRTIVLIPI
jgi:hypothetical protein